VIDSSDVVIHVLDARDPIGTRCKNVEQHIKKDAPHKHLIFLLNKCDLVPTWVTNHVNIVISTRVHVAIISQARSELLLIERVTCFEGVESKPPRLLSFIAKWVGLLSKDYPTLAFHASITNSFGKGSLIQLLRQFSSLHSDKKQISVGFIGYPNTGKSSIINTLRKKKVCNVAPIPGETKVWQYITLMKRIYLIDCPGIVPPSVDDTETDIVLKGVVRIENLKTPDEFIPRILERVRKEYLQRTYNIREWDDHLDFLGQIARKYGKLLKKGEPDITTVSKMILNDWLRGKIPYFTLPQALNENEEVIQEKESVDTEEKKKTVKGVEQVFDNIHVTTDFLPDDLRKEVESSMAHLDADNVIEESDSEIIVDHEKDEEEPSAPGWDELFESVVGKENHQDESNNKAGNECDDDEAEGLIKEVDKGLEKQIPDSASDLHEDSDEDVQNSVVESNEETSDEDTHDQTVNKISVENTKSCSKGIRGKGKRKRNEEDEEEMSKKKTKEPRMKTNKRKIGIHYYETANVKNRNRNKVKPQDIIKLEKRFKRMGNKKNSSK
ncbi:15340_t:CDS:2, partial [Acaulospora morrowiae]